MAKPRDPRHARSSTVRAVLLGSAVAGLFAASAAGAGAGCSTLGDDCLDSECWQPEGVGASGTGGGIGGSGTGGGIGGGGTGGTGGGAGGAEPTCDNGVVDPGELCFLDPYETYPTNALGAQDMVVLDCDGDGDVDVITVDQAGIVQLVVLRNDGAGVLGPPQQTASPDVYGTARIAVGNLDADDDIELLLAGIDHIYGAAFNTFDTTDCTLTLDVTRPGMGGAPWDALAFRFDGDTTDDPLALVDDSPDPQIAFIDTNQGSSVTLIDTTGTEPTGASMGDLDGDGKPDLIYVDAASDDVIVRPNLGTGLGSATVTAMAGGLRASAVGDVDGDSDLDVVVVRYDTDMATPLINDGAADLSIGPQLVLEGAVQVPAAGPVDVAVVDIDADGDLDIVTANEDHSINTSSVSVFLNDGSGAFVHATTANAPLVQGDSPLAVGRTPVRLEVVDMNGDGALDIVTASAHDNGATSLITVLLARP